MDILPGPWTPNAEQKTAVKFLLEHTCAGLLLDPGFGKTAVALAAFSILKKKGLANKMLLVAPLRPCWTVWPKEMWKWTNFNHLTFRVLHGTKKDAELRAEAKEPSDVLIVNVDALQWLLGASVTRTPVAGKARVGVDMARFKELGCDVLCVDELSKFKHTQNQRFKAMRPILPKFSRRWGLTGTPRGNHLENLFGEAYVLDEGRLLGQYITHFRNAYCVPSPDGFGWRPQEGADERVYSKLKPLMLRLENSGDGKAPQIVFNDIMVDLPGPARQLYDELEAEFVAELEKGGTVYAANGGVLFSKLRQVANGGLYYEAEGTGRLATDLHDEKAEAVADLVEELQGEPLLVAYDFGHDLDRLLRRLGKETPVLGKGGVKREMALESAWNRGELPVLLAHPASVGHGLNLQQSCRHVCWHSPIPDFELYDQFNRRVARQGNPNKRVTVHRVLARGTEDVDCIRMLESKERNQRKLFDVMLERIKK